MSFIFQQRALSLTLVYFLTAYTFSFLVFEDPYAASTL